MLARPAKQRGWNTLLRRYSAELVRLAEHSRSEAMLALAQQEAALAARAQAAMHRAEDQILKRLGIGPVFAPSTTTLRGAGA